MSNGRTWGTDVIDPSKWIDPQNKEYRTRSGKRIIGLEVKLTNSLGDEVTFPVKGSIDRGPRRQPEYCIWTLDGRSSLFGDSQNDLVEVEK